jgi:peptide chain release factor 1
VFDQPGRLRIEVTGDDLTLLTSEAGGHQIQRVPPTERKGRVHTSSVIVSVIPSHLYEKTDISISEKDLQIEWFSGTGKGGQNRNKVQACCRLTHIPSGITKSAQCRTRSQSYAEALNSLGAEIANNTEAESRSVLLTTKNTQTRNPANDRIRTYRFKDDIAIDHRTGKKASLSKVLGGRFDILS